MSLLERLQALVELNTEVRTVNARLQPPCNVQPSNQRLVKSVPAWRNLWFHSHRHKEGAMVCAIQSAEPGRPYTDDGPRCTVDVDCPSNDVHRSPQPRLPKSMRQDGDR